MAYPRPIGYFDTSVIQSEFRAKFNNCFVQLIHPNLPLEYWNIEASSEGNNVNFYSASGETINIKGGVITSEIEIVVCFPEEGWYFDSSNQNLVLITRFPSRQWRRAPNKDNMSIQVLSTGSKLVAAHLSCEILNLTVNPINENHNFKIINRKYLLRKLNEEWSILWYLDAQIGFYNHKQNRYFMTHSWYRLPSSLFKNIVYPKTFSLKV